jgi:hypothetical protein
MLIIRLAYIAMNLMIKKVKNNTKVISRHK